MPFDSLLTDSVSVLKKTGEVIDAVKASVQTEKIFIQRSDILIESGDLIRRSMSNGAVETYEVLDPGFHERFHSIPAGYQMHVKNLGVPEAAKAIQSITYNVSGINNRINQGSTDNSINIFNQNQDMQEHIDALRSEISRLDLSEGQKKDSIEVIDAIESQVMSSTPSKVVVKTLINSLPHAGSIASIGSFILSLLV